MSEPSYEHPDVVLIPDGPMLVRGVASIADDQGVVHPVARPVVAVCRCLKSSRMPWCDGTHKVIPRSAGAGSAGGAEDQGRPPERATQGADRARGVEQSGVVGPRTPAQD